MNPNEAPIGYEAVAEPKGKDACALCAFHNRYDECCATNCEPADRMDKVSVYFVAKIPKPEPYCWTVTGSGPFYGEFAESDAKREAKHCGGTTEAFPLYREPVDQSARIAELEAKVSELALENLSMQTELFEAMKDSARYRQVRRGQKWSVIDGIGNTLRAEELDAAIDAAMEANK